MPGKFELYFNDVPLVGTVDRIGAELWLGTPSGAGLLGRSVKTTERSGVDGLMRTGSVLSNRVISVPFTLRTDMAISIEASQFLDEAERVLMSVVNRPGLGELRLSYIDGYFMGELDAVDVSVRHEHFLKGTLSFVCPSPFLWGDTVTESFSGDGGPVATGLNYFVEPRLLWTPAQSSGAPVIDVDGRSLTIDTQVNAGQQVSVDAARKEVRVDGVLTVEHVKGQFPRVWDGSVLSVSPGGTVDVEYQQRWV